jgi:hypothetical protein
MSGRGIRLDQLTNPARSVELVIVHQDGHSSAAHVEAGAVHVHRGQPSAWPVIDAVRDAMADVAAVQLRRAVQDARDDVERLAEQSGDGRGDGALEHLHALLQLLGTAVGEGQ